MKSKRDKAMFAGLAVILTFGLLVGCGNTGEKNEKKVNIGYFPNITHSQAMVMKEQGLLEKKLKSDYSINWLSFQAGPAEVEAIFAEEVDIGYIGPVPAINANVKSKGDVVIIANACDAGAVLLSRADADITSVKDLEGKKVAIPQLGNTQHLNLLDLLDANGLAPASEGGDVAVQAVANADVQTLFEQKELDAALVPEPWGSILESKCRAKVVLDYDKIMNQGNYPTAVVVVRKEFLKENPEVVKKFLEAHLEATDYITDSPAKAQEIINGQIEGVTGKSYDVETLKTAFERLKMSSKVQKDPLKQFAEIAVQQGFTDRMPDEGLVDTSILEQLGDEYGTSD